MAFSSFVILVYSIAKLDNMQARFADAMGPNLANRKKREELQRQRGQARGELPSIAPHVVVE